MPTYIIRKKVSAPSLQKAVEHEQGRILEAYDEKEAKHDTSDAIGFAVNDDEADES